MNAEKFVEILGCDLAIEWKGCNAVSGLKIITKYLPEKGVEGAGHDVIYSVSVDEIVEAGITEEDAIQLRKLNWMVQQGEYLACFV